LRSYDFSRILEIESSLIDNMIWKEAADTLKDLEVGSTPSEKLDTIVKAITMIS
jgi:hypothetical protein